MNKLAKQYLRPSQIPTKACHGCGIGQIENWVLGAMDELVSEGAFEPKDVVVGAGIGCVGRQTFATWKWDNFGATHGRALAVATGIKLAKPNKKIVVFVGDGDATSIGISHLIHAARRNIGITLIMEDNLGFMSTGGQFSPSTPEGYVTQSSPYGMIEPTMDICETVKAAGATFVARYTTAQWAQAMKAIKIALANDGFSFVQMMFQCVEIFGAYALGTRDTMTNYEWLRAHTTGKSVDGQPVDFVWKTGILHDASNKRPEFAKLLHAQVQKVMEVKRSKQLETVHHLNIIGA